MLINFFLKDIYISACMQGTFASLYSKLAYYLPLVSLDYPLSCDDADIDKKNFSVEDDLPFLRL